MTNSLYGLGSFMLCILRIVSLGKTETTQDIERHIEQGDVVEYLNDKYKNELYINFNNTSYNNMQLNSFFNSYDSLIDGNEESKLGIAGNDNGLLILLALIADIIDKYSIEWHM